MCYESRLIVAEKTGVVIDGRIFAQRLATLDLGVNLPTALWFKRNGKPTNCCLFLPGDGENPVVQDKYGEPLLEVPLDVWRDPRGLALDPKDRLTMVIQHFGAGFISSRHNELAVFHFGY